MTMKARLAGLALLLVSALGHGPADLGFEHLYEESPKEVEEQCTNVAALPSFLDGTFVIQSIAKLSMGKQQVRTWLDAFYKIHSVSISKRRLCYMTKIIRTGYYNKSVSRERVAAGVLFLEPEPPRTCSPLPGGLCNLLAPNDNNFAATYRVKDNDGYRYALMTDQADHMDFDLGSLEVSGKRKFKDGFIYGFHNVQGGGAHLQCEAGKGLSASKCDGLLYGVLFETPTGPGKNYIDLYRLRPGRSSLRELVARVPVPFSPGGVHSFGLTSDYAIIPLQPYTTDAKKLLDGLDLVHSIDTMGNTSEIYLVHLGTGSVQTFHFEKPIFYVHFVNSWQSGTDVLFDISVFDQQPFTNENPGNVLSVLRNKTARDAASNTQTIRRFKLDLTSGIVREEKLTSGPAVVDFPVVNPSNAGVPYCIYYGVEWKHDGTSFGSMALRKHDTCTGSVTFFYEPSHFVSEFFFVANGGPDEDDGVLLGMLSAGDTKSSSFVVLDAKTMQKIASHTLPAFLAMTAHGAWYPNEGALVDIVV